MLLIRDSEKIGAVSSRQSHELCDASGDKRNVPALNEILRLEHLRDPVPPHLVDDRLHSGQDRIRSPAAVDFLDRYRVENDLDHDPCQHIPILDEPVEVCLWPLLQHRSDPLLNSPLELQVFTCF